MALAVTKPRGAASGGILGYSLDALPDHEGVAWHDARAVAAYMAALPVVRLLHPRLQSRADKGAIFSSDYAFLVSQTVSEWYGIFGYPQGQVLPGLRAPLPKAVVHEAQDDELYFQFLTDCFFQAFPAFFRPGQAFQPHFPWLPQDSFLRPVCWFYSDLEFFQGMYQGKLLWKVKNVRVPAERYYEFSKERSVFDMVTAVPPDSIEWKPAEGLDYYASFFFPVPFRHFWTPASLSFFQRFSHGAGFDPRIFDRLHEVTIS